MECIFCEIIRGNVKSKIVHEDEISLAFLDINPRTKGMTIIIPKQHYEKFDENFELSTRVFFSALIVAEKIKQALNPREILFSIISSELVKHFHVRIYPVFDEVPLIETKPLSITDEELENIAEKIRSIRIELKEEKKEVKKKEEKKEEEKERKRSEEEVYWIKRDFEIP
ncbi:MAG: HIT family protein [Candidatus Aenigmatarchaeota archaeon]